VDHIYINDELINLISYQSK